MDILGEPIAPRACPECGDEGHPDFAHEPDEPQDEDLICERCRAAIEIDRRRPLEEVMHPTTREYLRARHANDLRDQRANSLRVENAVDGQNNSFFALERAFRAWRDAGYPDADPGPEAAKAPTLDDLARAVAPLETSPLAGVPDLRAELDAARVDHLADVNARAAEIDDLRAKLQAMHRRAQGAEAEATRLGRWTIELRETNRRLRGDLSDARADADHWRGIAEELSARPRLRDRVWRWVGVGR